MSQVRTRTADGHEVEIGQVYWDYDWRQSRVTGISHDETWADGRVVRWFTCERVDNGSRAIFDGSRLSKRDPRGHGR